MIPRIFHRIWLGAAPPQQYVDFGQTWLEQNPGWELREWDKTSIAELGLKNWDLYDRAHEVVGRWPRLVPRFRSDVARYEILHRFGGLYLDHDFEALRPLEPVIRDLDCFAVEEKPGLTANGFMGAQPEHPFVGALIEGLPNRVRALPGAMAWQLSGPGYLTDVAATHPNPPTVLPTSQFLPYHYTQLGKGGGPGAIPPDAIAHHVWGSARQQVSVVIPWRDIGCPHREAALQWTLARYAQFPEWQIVVATDGGDGKWCKARAVNEGVRASCGDVIVVADGDLWSDGVPEAVKLVQRGTKWVIPYQQLYRMNEHATSRVLQHESPAVVMQDLSLLHEFSEPYPGVIGGGIVVLKRTIAEDVPMDERFLGWGGEDISWGYALKILAGRPARLPHNLYHLWHPPQERISRNVGSEENLALYKKYHAAMRVPSRMRRIVAEARRGG